MPKLTRSEINQAYNGLRESYRTLASGLVQRQLSLENVGGFGKPPTYERISERAMEHAFRCQELSTETNLTLFGILKRDFISLSVLADYLVRHNH